MEKLDIIIVVCAILLSVILLLTGFGGAILETGSLTIYTYVISPPATLPHCRL